jgi:nitrite reductase/ring-hydroxylating ferredoxin subunit
MSASVGTQLICASDELLDGGDGVRFKVMRHGVEEPAFIVRWRGVAHAFINRCGHVPIELDWQEGKFFDLTGRYLICATHGAMYSPESGRCVGGRCDGRGLVPLVVLECDGNIYLNE